MKPSLLGLSLLLSLILTFSWSCSKKQSNAEIPLETPVPTGTMTGTGTVALAPAASATPQLQFIIPSPTPSGPPMEYEVEDIQGTVLALLDGAADPVTVEEGETLETGDTLIAKDNSQATLSLNDVTAVHVSEGTTVKIADLEPNATQGFISRLELTSGKVLSEVEKLDSSHSTFEVESGGVICGVRGTAFEVQNADGQVTTNTFHGAVEVDKDDQSQLVNGGEHSTFVFNKKGFLAKRKLNAVENNRYKAWGKIYKRARQKRAQRMRWIKSHPHSAQAQKFIHRREALRQKRLQFQMNRANPNAAGAPAQERAVNRAPKKLSAGAKHKPIQREHPLLKHRRPENQPGEKTGEPRKSPAVHAQLHRQRQERARDQKNAAGAPKRSASEPKKQNTPNASNGNNKKKFPRDHGKKDQKPQP